jgi:hypothetical protein
MRRREFRQKIDGFGVFNKSKTDMRGTEWVLGAIAFAACEDYGDPTPSNVPRGTLTVAAFRKGVQHVDSET